MENENGHGKLMPSWKMRNWPKVMEYRDKSWNFIDFDPELYQICMIFATTKHRCRKSAFSNVFRKTSQMHNRE